MFSKYPCVELIALCLLFLAGVAQASEPIELTRGEAPRHPQQPQLSVDANGGIHIVYGIHDVVCYHSSTDGGETFSKPAELTFAHAMSLGMRRGPRIAATDKAICITAIGGKQGKGRDGDVLAMSSQDGGKTWTGPVQVNDVDDAAREGLHAMAAGPKGEMCCVWLDLRNKATEIAVSTSLDGGKTWSKNVLAYKSPDGSVCECCHPSVTFDERGKVLVQWRNALGGNRDIYVASSTDGGKSFGPAKMLGTGNWALRACPMDGGAIAVSGNQVSSVWRREKSLYLSTSVGSDEQLLGPGEQPWIAATKTGPYIVWLAKRGEQANLLTPGSKTPTKLASRAGDPVIAANPKGTGPVVAAWESRDGKNHTIVCQVVSE
ncbi:sialidase family protein [Anatilimnocola sp. NA78]|uniref:sialidase family protein n=1 Tax=Anatilimnocola sp. NA78 TaxID=3415683 RepID=UPI003CE53012